MGKKILIIILLLVPTTLWAANNLAKAKKLTAQMKYMQALWDINQVLKSSKSGPDQLAEAYELKGMCMAALGKPKASITAYRHLLAINPNHKLSPKVSPKLKQPFERALELSQGKKPIVLAHQVPEPAEKLGGMEIKVSIDANPFKMIKRVRLRYKAGKGKERQIVRKVKRTGQMAFKLPAKIKASGLSYYFEALNKRGGVVKRLGSQSAPYAFVVGPKTVEKPASKPAIADLDPDEAESKPG
ncbi:MAG: tetratricopeptide repeat protein, partial [Deltaproteobacteria bacterium]|nr:tetratricopeptide repeat protein [Deltaproteobacteria bacterium]